MSEIFLYSVPCLLLIVIGLLIGIWSRTRAVDLAPVMSALDGLARLLERAERTFGEELARNRLESAEHGRGLRTEVQISLKTSTDQLVQSLEQMAKAQQVRLEDFADELKALGQTSQNNQVQLRQELVGSLNQAKESQERRLSETANGLQGQLEAFGRRLSGMDQAQQENAQQTRIELAATVKDFRDSLLRQLSELSGLQNQHFENFGVQMLRWSEMQEQKSEALRGTVEGRLKELQSDNATQLEEMRRTVDEKLQSTLERRLGESFQLVSDRLEQVHKGLGEMQSLASGVGDLKRVLTNVKTRGTWGEVQLGNLLEQILTPEQFARNVVTKSSGRETVEFALKLPGHEDQDGKVVWLPIDAKFPKEDYERLVEAAERGDAVAVEQAAKDLELRIRSQARDIRDKYVEPPNTTDFGLLYLPTEGLFAEVLRRPGLLDVLQRELRVVVVGPTTLAALLNSLQMGFRTLAIQKRSSEVWKVLAGVKGDFGKFGDLLEKVKRKLEETGNTIDEAVNRSRQLERKLKKVEELPSGEAGGLLSQAAAEPGHSESEG